MIQIPKRVWLVWAGAVGVVILLAHEFSRGLLSVRELRTGLLLCCVVAIALIALVARKSGESFWTFHKGPFTSSDEGAKSHGRSHIRIWLSALVVLAILLILRLRDIGSVPLLQLLVTIAISLSTMASIIWLVVRRRKGIK